jgi:hypothetical protein
LRKIILIILFVSFPIANIGLFFQRYLIACEFSYLFGFQPINEQFHVGADMPTERYQTLSKIVTNAAKRISDTYGTTESQPKVLFTSDSETTKWLGANDTATMHRAPWRTCIVIGAKGQNVDVMAHEWLHAEIQHRVGFWRFIQEIPVWFDEGAALTLDYRDPFLPENIELPDEQVQSVKSLVTGSKFFSNDVMTHYQAARMAVIPLIKLDSFYRDLEKISDGASFEQVFLQADRIVIRNTGISDE